MPSIRDFSGGVLNQELQNRDNGNGVLFDCKNVLSSWNGELRKRTGTRLLKELGGNAKIIPYRLPNGNDMIMILKDSVINCYTFDDEGNLVPYVTTTGGGAISFPSGDSWHTGASNTNGDWTVNSNCRNPSLSYDMFYSSSFLAGRGAPFYRDTMIAPGQFFSIHNTSDVVFSGCKITWLTTDNYNHNFVWRAGTSPVIQYSDDGSTWTPIQTDVSTPEMTSEDFPSEGFPIGNVTKTWYRYTIKNNSYSVGHKYWRIVFSEVFNSGEFHSSVDGDPGSVGWAGTRLMVENTSFIGVTSSTNLVFNNCPYENEDFDNIKWSQNNRTLTMACKGKSPYQITISGGTFSDSLFAPSDYTTIWQTIGYPSCVTYYQNRLWFGGFSAAPTRVYASEFGKFDKFTIPTPILSTSPIMADGTEIYNIIENMWGGNNALYCLSEDGISMIDAQGAIVATDQVEFKLRNREPVNSMVPTVKDDIMIYLGRDKRKILVTDYDFVVQRFRANCVSDNYNDFLQSGIKELHYIPRKSSLIYGVLENGQWFALLFDVAKNKNSIYPFEISGNILDLQPIKIGDQTKLLIITQLPTYQYVLEEKLPQSDQEIMDFMSKQEKIDYTRKIIGSSDCYLDHSIVRHYDLATTEIGGLPYNVGTKLEVIADGQYLGEKEVLTRDSNELYAWEGSYFDGTVFKNTVLYTSTENPTTNDVIYDESFSKLEGLIIESVVEVLGITTRINVRHPFVGKLLGYTYSDTNVYLLYPTQLVVDENGNNLGVATTHSDSQIVFQGQTYNRNASIDKELTLSTTNAFPKESNKNTVVSPSYILLEEGVTDVTIGYKYDSYTVLKFVSPYNIRKFPKEISVNFINSGYLEVGNTFDSLKSVLNNLVESVNVNNDKILMNGNYTKTLDKQAFETPYVIVRSDKGLPFIITGIDYKVDISNYQGGV